MNSQDSAVKEAGNFKAGRLLSAFALLLTLAACGGGGGAAPNAGASAASGDPGVQINYLTVTSDDYGLIKPNFYYSTDNAAFWSIQANVAKDAQDQNSLCVIRIDIPKQGGGAMPAIGKTFSIEDNPLYEKFPGTFAVFNGHKSVGKKVERGIVSFTPDSTASAEVNGVFDVTLTDYDSRIDPPPQYHLKGKFSFRMGSYGPANPLPAEVYPAKGKDAYDQLCANCHSLGDYDPAGTSASNLSQRGGELPMVYPGATTEHQGVALGVQAMQDLRIFLNAR